MIRLLTTILILTLPIFSQIPMQFYDFESNANRSNSETSAELIINSITDDNVTSIGGVFSRAEGNPSTGSSLYRSSWEGNGLTDPGTGATEYLQLTVNTSDFAEIFLSLDAYGTLLIGSSGGVGLLYSTDGSTFSASSTFSLTTSFANYEWDLSDVASIENISEVTFRIYAYGDDPLLGTAEFYIDNLTISAKRITGAKTLADYSLIDDANGASGFPAFNSLVLDANSAQINLSSNLIIADTVRFTNGILVTGSNKIQVDSNCFIEGYNSGSYVNGFFAHTFHTKPLSQSKFYPVGSSSDYRPAQITLVDVTSAGEVTVKHFGTAPSSTSLPTGITNLSNKRYWEVDIGNGMTFGVANTYGVQLYFGSNDGITLAGNLEVVRGTNGSDWTESDSSGLGADWVFGSFNNPTDNDFTFGDGGENALPVELTEFDYYLDKSNLILYWSTATEVNSFLFEIQRKNVESGQWQRRGSVVASGVSNSPKHYTFFEEEPIVGTSFYRLKIIDIDGTYEFSKQINVEYEHQISDLGKEVKYQFNLSQNYPNPFNPSTKIKYSVPAKSTATLLIFNSLGELVEELYSGVVDAGIHILRWNASAYSSGIYFLQIFAKTEQTGEIFNQTRKLILIK